MIDRKRAVGRRSSVNLALVAEEKMHPSTNLPFENTPCMEPLYEIHRDFLGERPDGGSLPASLIVVPGSSREWVRGAGFCRFPVFRLRPKRNGWQASHAPHSRWTISYRAPVQDSEASS